ncbi:MAG: InlB B-repeat-containing protein [Lachnospiraceae bacterium]|nr:InlB B-repeat-containing protein [Lachnospiraceae bacterium]
MVLVFCIVVVFAPLDGVDLLAAVDDDIILLEDVQGDTSSVSEDRGAIIEQISESGDKEVSKSEFAYEETSGGESADEEDSKGDHVEDEDASDTDSIEEDASNTDPAEDETSNTDFMEEGGLFTSDPMDEEIADSDLTEDEDSADSYPELINITIHESHIYNNEMTADSVVRLIVDGETLYFNNLKEAVSRWEKRGGNLSLLKDQHYMGDFSVPYGATFSLEGYELNVYPGSFFGYGDVSLGGGTLKVTDDIYQSFGSLILGGGRIECRDLNISSNLKTASASTVDMSDPSDCIELKGALYINGKKDYISKLNGELIIGTSFNIAESVQKPVLGNDFSLELGGKGVLDINLGKTGLKISNLVLPCRADYKYNLMPVDAYGVIRCAHHIDAEYTINEYHNKIHASLYCSECGKRFDESDITFSMNYHYYEDALSDLDLFETSVDEKGRAVLKDIVIYGDYEKEDFIGWYKGKIHDNSEKCDRVGLYPGTTITLYAAFEGMYLTKDDISLYIGEHAQVYPQMTAVGNLTIGGYDNGIVNVTDSGLVSAVGVGETDITYTLNSPDRTYTRQCHVKVMEYPVYKITYDLNGGDHVKTNPSEYTRATDKSELVLKDAYKEGYLFDGWFESGGRRVYSIDPATDRDIHLIAAYTANNVGLRIEEIEDVVYTGSPLKPAVRVYYGMQRLTEGVDYTLSYKNNRYAANINDKKAPQVMVKGKGKFSGSVTRKFNILPTDISDVEVVEKYSNYIAGKTFEPSPTVTLYGKSLKSGKDYKVDVTNVYVKTGRYECTVTGMGNYCGMKKYYFSVVDANKKASLAKASVKVLKKLKPGETIGPEDIVVTLKKTVLQYGRDYIIDGNYFPNAGTYTVYVKAPECCNGYYAYKKHTVKVEGVNLNKVRINIPSAEYTGEEITPDISITYGEKTLSRGTDYLVTSVKNNIKCGIASVGIKGIGSYSGSKTVNFTIKKIDSRKLKVESLQSEYQYCKSGTKPRVVLKNGDIVIPDDTLVYTYLDNDKVGRGCMTITGMNIDGEITKFFNIVKKDIRDITFAYCPDSTSSNNVVPIMLDDNGRRLEIDVDFVYNTETMLAKGIGNYYGERIIRYSIVSKDVNLGNARVSARSGFKSFYTGKDIDKKSIKLKVTMGKKELLYGTDYDIVIAPGQPDYGNVNIYVIPSTNSVYKGIKAFKVKIYKRQFTE